MKAKSIRPDYVDFIPAKPQEGILYVSKKFQTASHLCCCGCGTKIVTPLRNTEYTLTEERGLVSLYPSIGNWNHPCQSHYWIRKNKIVWAAPMTMRQIEQGRINDDALREAYFHKVAWPWWRRLLAKLKCFSRK